MTGRQTPIWYFKDI